MARRWVKTSGVEFSDGPAFRDYVVGLLEVDRPLGREHNSVTLQAFAGGMYVESLSSWVRTGGRPADVIAIRVRLPDVECWLQWAWELGVENMSIRCLGPDTKKKDIDALFRGRRLLQRVREQRGRKKNPQRVPELRNVLRSAATELALDYGEPSKDDLCEWLGEKRNRSDPMAESTLRDWLNEISQLLGRDAWDLV
jgi:hypothetical protein